MIWGEIVERSHILFIAGLAVLLVFFGFSRGSITNAIEAKGSSKHFPSMRDIEYIAFEQDGEFNDFYRDKVILSRGNEDIIEIIKGCIIKGKVIDSTNILIDWENSITMSIKLKDGTYTEGIYSNGFIVFDRQSNIIIQPEQYMKDLIEEILAGKQKVSPVEIEYNGQVRNNKIVLGRNIVYSYISDKAFSEFNPLEKNTDLYIKGLISEAEAIGINGDKLKKAMNSAEETLKDKAFFPVIIETGVYRNKECFILTYTWDPIEKPDEVKPLGHVITMVVSEDGRVMFQGGCR